MKAVWRPCLADIPQRPGVYFFRDAQGAILYIGKALRLRRRIASYFHAHRRQPRRLRRMLARARAVAIEETSSELEALLLESRLLKQHTPPFNRLSTAYVALPFVKLTVNEPFPRLVITRDYVPDGGCYLGPFPRFDSALAVLTALQRLFRLRTCEEAVVPGIAPQPCEAFQLHKCVAPCLGLQQASEHRHEVEALLAGLAQGREAILQQLTEARQQAAAALFFERAGHLHRLQAALAEATIGRPLTLLPVAQRTLLAIFEGSTSPKREVYYIRHGLFAGKIILGDGADDRQRLEALLTGGQGADDPTSRGGEVAVDELRLVAAWLQRTQAQARWLFVDPWMSLSALLETAMQALSLPGSWKHLPHRSLPHPRPLPSGEGW